MGLNDPQWGKKNNSGPPDLEELLRNFNNKIESLLGGKSGRDGKGGGGGTPGSGPAFGLGAGLIAAIVAVLWVVSGFYIVDESQRGVV
ncbi:MAG: protease modulator HflK N-terminal domain-containing protein, partial [Candidatus Nitrotoga sp.]